LCKPLYEFEAYGFMLLFALLYRVPVIVRVILLAMFIYWFLSMICVNFFAFVSYETGTFLIEAGVTD